VAVDPETGAAAPTEVASTGDASVAVPTELASARPHDAKVFGALAAVELIVIVLAPGVGAVYFRRRARRKLGAF
jgi:phosphate transport system substrate-binding protein